jgi:nucleoside-diphosphate-sugar epimerase/acyl carrier protein
LAESEDRIEWIRGSLSDADSLKRLVRGVSAVVHCAGAVRGGSAEPFNRVNVEGVARLVQAAQQMHPAPRFLLISSLAAREPRLSFYAASKRQGEAVLQSAAGAMPYTVLRPPAVYGPGDRELLPLLLWMRRGLAPMVGGPQARFSLMFVADLAAAVQRALEATDLKPGPFEIHDGRPGGYAWVDVMAAMAAISGRRVRGLRIPHPVLAAAAAANLGLARVIGYAPMLTPGKVRELTHPDWVGDNAAFTRATGWAPRVDLEEGLRRTLWGTRFGAAARPGAGNRNPVTNWSRNTDMHTYDELLVALIGLIQPLAPDGRPIDANTDLVADLDFDSLKVMSLIEQVEDRFDISVPLNILPDIRTVNDFAVQLQRILGGA